MIPFHTTIKLKHYKHITRAPFNAPDLGLALGQVFPAQKVELIDSGRSALALAIEKLDLRGKKILMPAYVCNVLLPVLDAYEIQPVFLDIDQKTFTPSNKSYTEDLLKEVDAVLLVATYGLVPEKSLIEKIKSLGKVVIEDYAHVHFPKTETRISSDARYYSLPKLMPVADGGILVRNSQTSKESASSDPGPKFREPEALSLLTLKNWLKIFALPQFLISYFSILRNKKMTKIPAWRGIDKANCSTERILYYYLTNEKVLWRAHDKYCQPVLVSNPHKAQVFNLVNGVISLRIWQDPIIFYADQNPDNFPVTKEVSGHILCSPYF